MRQGTIALFTLAMLVAAPALAQKSEDVVKWTSEPPSAALKPGAPRSGVL